MMQLWKSLYPTDVHHNSILPPLPPGAVLLSDEIIERDNPPSRMFSTISTPYLPKHLKKDRSVIRLTSKRQSLPHTRHDAGRWARPSLEEIGWSTEKRQDEQKLSNGLFNYLRESRHRIRRNQQFSISQDMSSSESVSTRRHKPRRSVRHMSYDSGSASTLADVPHSGLGRGYNEIRSINMQDRPMDDSSFRRQYSSARLQRNRTVSESVLARRNEDIVPMQLKDHALRDRTRPMSRRKAIRITDNLLCVPGIERIVEKRFYVKKDSGNDSFSHSKRKSINGNRNAVMDVAETNKGMCKLLDEMRDIKSDIELLQKKHAELLDETRSLKPRLRTPIVSRGDAIVQTDTDSSRMNIGNNSCETPSIKNSLQYSSSSSVSSDETIKNIHSHRIAPTISNPAGTPLQRKDVPFSYETSKTNSGVSTSDELEKYGYNNIRNDSGGVTVEDCRKSSITPEKNNNTWTSYENLSFLRKETDTVVPLPPVKLNSGSKNLRVFKVTPPTSVIDSDIQSRNLRSEEFIMKAQPNFAPAQLETKMDVGIDPLMAGYNTWPSQQCVGTLSNQLPNFDTSKNYVQSNTSNDSGINQLTGKNTNYANVIREAYGIAGGHSAMKPVPTTTMSYASAEEDTLLENLNISSGQANNVFNLMEPALSYQNSSFHIDANSLPHNLAQKQYMQRQPYGHSIMAATVPRTNAGQSTFEDLVHQYNAVNNVINQNQGYPGDYNSPDIMQTDDYLTAGQMQNYENFIC